MVQPQAPATRMSSMLSLKLRNSKKCSLSVVSCALSNGQRTTTGSSYGISIGRINDQGTGAGIAHAFMGIACSRILTFAIPIVLGSEILVGCGFSGRRDHSYRFQVANRRLYAIETGSSYGAEGPVYTTDYVGNTWRQIEFPANTYLLSGNGTDLFALTSDGTVWRGSQEGKPWTSVISLDGKYHYSILADNGGGFLVGGLNELTWHDKDGKLLRRFTFDPGSKGDVLFASAHF